MWVYNLDPVLFSLGPLQVRWYGLVYVLGFFLAAWWLLNASKKKQIGLSSDEIWDLMVYLMLGVLAGSRLFMLFWNPGFYLVKPWHLLYIWEGGMSFHGGFAGVIAACWWWCKKHKHDFWRIADIVAVPAILALAFGRIANFVNGELVGKVWNGSWCVVFPDYGNECRHPNMIYSFFQRMAVFGWLWSLSVWKEFTPGFIFWNFVFWEGLGRIIVDFYREYPTGQMYFGFSLGQWFSLVMVIVALWIFIKRYRVDWRKIIKLEKNKE